MPRLLFFWQNLLRFYCLKINKTRDFYQQNDCQDNKQKIKIFKFFPVRKGGNRAEFLGGEEGKAPLFSLSKRGGKEAVLSKIVVFYEICLQKMNPNRKNDKK